MMMIFSYLSPSRSKLSLIPAQMAVISAFTSAFNTTMQNFDQVRSSTQDAFANFEKSVETAMKASQGQFGQAPKAAKSRAK